MPLVADLRGRFSAGSFSFDVSANGVVDAFGVTLPEVPGLDPGRVAGVVELLGSLDVTSAGTDVGTVARLLVDVGAPVVDAAGLVEPLRAALDLLGRLPGGDLDRVRGALTADVGGGLGVDGLVDRVRALAPILDDELVDLVLSQLRSVLGVDPLAGLGALGAVLPGGLALLGLLGGLMVVEHVTDRVAHATGLVRSMLDRGRAQQLLDRLAGWEDLPDLLAAADPDDVDMTAALTGPVQELADTTRELADLLRRGLAFGEATVVHLDLDGLAAQLTLAGSLLDPAGLPAVGAAAGRLRGWLDPALRFRPPSTAATVEGFWQAATDQVGTLAGVVARLDPVALAGPVGEVFGLALAPLHGLERAAHEVTAAVTSVVSAVRGALDAVDLTPVTNALRDALAPVADAIDALDTLLGDAEAAIGAAVAPVLSALGDARTTLTTLAGAARAATEDLAGALADLHLEALARELHDGLQAVADAIDAARPGPVIDTVVGVLSTAADVLGAVPRALLPDDAKAELEAGCQQLHAIDPAALEDALVGALAELRDEFDAEVLAEISAKYQELVDFLAEIDPRPFIEQVERDHVRPFLERVRSFDPAVPLAGVVAAVEAAKAAIAAFDPARMLTPLTGAFADLRARVAALDPAALLAPLTAQVAPLVGELRARLGLADWSAHLDAFEALVRGALSRVDPAPLVDLLEAGHDRVVDQLAEGTGATPVLGSVVSGLLAGRGLAVAPSSLAEVGRWVAAGRGTDVVQARLQAARADLDATVADVRALDPAPLLARLGQLRADLLAAAGTHPELSLLRADVEVALSGDPVDLLGPLVANRGRYLDRLQEASATVRGLAAAGHEAVTLVAAGLRDQLQPLADVGTSLRAILTATGVPVDRPLGEALVDLARLLRPATLLAPLVPVVVDLRDRLDVAVHEALVAPAKDAAARLSGILDVVDLSAITASLVPLHDDLVARLDALDPAVVLGDVLDSIGHVRQRLVDLDPLGPVRPLTTELRDLVAAFEAEALPSVVFAPVVAAYESLVGAAGGLDVRTVLAPVLGALDEVSAQLQAGMDGFAQALGRVLAACDSDGGLPIDVGVDVGGGLGGAIGATAGVSL